MVTTPADDLIFLRGGISSVSTGVWSDESKITPGSVAVLGGVFFGLLSFLVTGVIGGDTAVALGALVVPFRAPATIMGKLDEQDKDDGFMMELVGPVRGCHGVALATWQTHKAVLL